MSVQQHGKSTGPPQQDREVFYISKYMILHWGMSGKPAQDDRLVKKPGARTRTSYGVYQGLHDSERERIQKKEKDEVIFVDEVYKSPKGTTPVRTGRKRALPSITTTYKPAGDTKEAAAALTVIATGRSKSDIGTTVADNIYSPLCSISVTCLVFM